MRSLFPQVSVEVCPHGTNGILRIAALFTLVVGMAGLLRAETFPVKGTAGFETGLKKIADVTMDRQLPATIDWGDSTPDLPGLLRCALVGFDCEVYGTHRYAVAGTYTVTVSYLTPILLIAKSQTTTATIEPVGDFVILSIGDSVASGEGDPVVDFSLVRGMARGYWDDPGSDWDFPDISDPEKHELIRACHRSLIAGPAQAARQVAATNSITFIHFACSGATVKTKTGNVSDAADQLIFARRHLPRIDVLLISAGANNMQYPGGAGFGSILGHCLSPFSNCSEDDDFKTGIKNSIDGLADEYHQLDQEIHCVNPGSGCIEPDKQIPKLVLIAEYFDPTHVKQVDNPAEDGFPGIGCLDLGVNASEWKFFYNSVMVPLNNAVKASPWHAVTGMQDDFMAHGYCAGSDRWIVTGPDSLDAIGGVGGTGHPNADGHDNYKTHIYNTLVALNPPVTTAKATAGGSPYAFGSWTGKDVEVTFSAKNFIRESGVGNTYYAVDNPNCLPESTSNCAIFGGPFTITAGGKHVVSFFSDNAHSGREALQSVEVWIDKEPPVMTCSATPEMLWPPNHEFIPVMTFVVAIDEVSGPEPFVLTSLTASEGSVSSETRGWVIGTPDTDGEMNSTRLGSEPGRVYALTYESADDVGNVGNCVVEVTVPHDQRDKNDKEKGGNGGGPGDNNAGGNGNGVGPGGNNAGGVGNDQNPGGSNAVASGNSGNGNGVGNGNGGGQANGQSTPNGKGTKTP
jgi:hypothetical protein